MNPIQHLWERIKEATAELERPLERAVEEVDSWDGSPSNYQDTDAYCAACLLDLNAAAGRSEKVQSHCMLPVKAPGSTAYADKAIHAAAGGHGITQVKRPDDVSEDDWTAALKAAANKLISLYGQMDEQAPDAVYELAGKTAPERAISMGQISAQVSEALEKAFFEDGSMERYPWLNDIYEDQGQLVAIISAGGKLYRAPVSVDGTSVVLGELAEVEVQFTPRRRSFSITRQADGRFRWFAVACSAVLNRVGEIDSRALFDSFVEAAKTEGYPKLRFYHDPRMDFGEADWLEREGNLLLASGLFDEEHPLAAAFIDACEKNRGNWGTSDGFVPLEPPQLMEVGAGVTIPVYTKGICREISVLPEDHAAAWFTAITSEVTRMRKDVRDALVLLFGDEAKADEFADTVDQRNREIDERQLVTRDDGQGEDAPEPAAEGTTEEQPEPEAEPQDDAEAQAPNRLVLDDAALDAIAARVGAGFDARFAELAARIDALPAMPDLAPINEALGAVRERLSALERDEEEKRREWQADRPARQTTVISYRPRQANAPSKDAPLDRRAVAEATLAEMPPR